jgi:hypothetical protein
MQYKDYARLEEHKPWSVVLDRFFRMVRTAQSHTPNLPVTKDVQ